MEASTRKILFPMIIAFVACLVVTAVILGPGRPRAGDHGGRKKGDDQSKLWSFVQEQLNQHLITSMNRLSND